MSNKKTILEELIEELWISKSLFAKKIGKTTANINMYINEGRNLGHKYTQDIIKAFPNVNIKFLLKGEKPIFIEPTEVVNSNELVKETNTSYVVEENKLLKQQLELAQKRIKMLEDREEVGGNQGSVDNLSADHKITGKKRNRSK